MDDGHVLVLWVALVCFAIVALCAWYFSADQRALRAMRAVPLRRIADVKGGEKVRIVGEVEAPRTLRAPLSGRACAYWRVTVREQRGSGKSRRWVTIIDEQEGVDFFLRDGMAKALIKTAHAQAVLDQDGRYVSGFMRDAPPELEVFLAQRGHSSKGWFFNKNMQYREGIVEPGETVAAVGVGRWERDPDEEPTAGGYRDVIQPRRLVLDRPEDGLLLISDRVEAVGTS